MVNKWGLKRKLASRFKRHWHFQIVATCFALLGVYAMIKFLDASLNRTLLFWMLFVSYVILVFFTNLEGDFTKPNIALNAKTLTILLLALFFMLNVKSLAFPKHGNVYEVSAASDTSMYKRLSDGPIKIRKHQIQDDFIPEKFLSIENENNKELFREVIKEISLTECSLWTKSKCVKCDIIDSIYSIYVYKNGYISISVTTDEVDKRIYYKVDDNYDLMSKLQPVIESELSISKES
jgi:hypothetical protein